MIRSGFNGKEIKLKVECFECLRLNTAFDWLVRFFYLNKISFSSVVEQAEICLIEYIEEKQAVAATTVEVSI